MGTAVWRGPTVDILERWARGITPTRYWRSSTVVSARSTVFQPRRAAMTERMLQRSKTLHPDYRSPYGRCWRPRSHHYDMEKVLDACAKHGVAMECNPSRPPRLKTVYRRCQGTRPQVVDFDGPHKTRRKAFSATAVTMARRGWLGDKADVINTPAGWRVPGRLSAKPGHVPLWKPRRTKPPGT